MQVIYHWAFSVAPALCPCGPPHSKSGGARAPPGYMVPAPLLCLRKTAPTFLAVTQESIVGFL